MILVKRPILGLAMVGQSEPSVSLNGEVLHLNTHEYRQNQ